MRSLSVLGDLNNQRCLVALSNEVTSREGELMQDLIDETIRGVLDVCGMQTRRGRLAITYGGEPQYRNVEKMYYEEGHRCPSLFVIGQIQSIIGELICASVGRYTRQRRKGVHFTKVLVDKDNLPYDIVNLDSLKAPIDEEEKIVACGGLGGIPINRINDATVYDFSSGRRRYIPEKLVDEYATAELIARSVGMNVFVILRSVPGFVEKSLTGRIRVVPRLTSAGIFQRIAYGNDSTGGVGESELLALAKFAESDSSRVGIITSVRDFSRLDERDLSRSTVVSDANLEAA